MNIRLKLKTLLNISPKRLPLEAVHARDYIYQKIWRTKGNPLTWPRIGELRTQKLKSRLVRTLSLNVLPLKPGDGQYTAIHATLTARDLFLSSTLPVHSPAFFQKPLPIFLCWLWLTHGFCVGPQNKMRHPAGCRFPRWVPAEYK